MNHPQLYDKDVSEMLEDTRELRYKEDESRQFNHPTYVGNCKENFD